MIQGMFRTRDFVLVLTAVAFLVMAIGVTVFGQMRSATTSGSELWAAALPDQEYTAIVVDDHQFSRIEKLAAMREKIAASGQLTLTAPEPVEEIVDVTEEATTVTESEDTQAGSLQQCPGYVPTTVAWSPAGIEIEEVEGARLIYRQQVAAVTASPSASTTTQALASVPGRDIVLQLPVRSLPAPSTSCIASDVIGIATDGSLIRNAEAGVYGIFDSTTLVGWALDGFPIYGSAATAGDACGGVMAVDGYRYQISPDRETILNCYSAAPIRL